MGRGIVSNSFGRRFALLTFALAILLTIGGPLAQGQAPGDAALEKLVPDSTVLFVTFPDLGASREKWKDTALYKIWTDKEVEFAIKKLLGSFDSFKKEAEGEFKEATGVELESALDILQGQVSFAVIALPDEESRSPKAAFALDFGGGKDALLKLLDFLKKMMAGDTPGGGKITLEGTEVYTFGEEDMVFHYAFLDATVLIATGKETMAGMLRAYQGKTEAVLAKNKNFIDTRRATVREGDEAIFLYADFPALSEGLSGMMEIETKELGTSMSALGADAVKSLGISVTFTDGGVSDALYIHAPGPKKGLLQIISLAKTHTPHLDLVPADAVSYMGMKLDFGRIWDLSLEMIKAFDEEAYKEIEKEIQAFNEKTGVNVRDDLIGSMGDEISYFGAFPKGGGILPEGVAVFSLKDPDRFETAFSKLMGAAGMEKKDLPFGGRTIHYFSVSMKTDEPDEEKKSGMGRSPIPGVGMEDLFLLNLTSFQNYFIEGNYLFASNLAQSLKKVILKIEGKDRFVSLGRNPHFERLRSKLPGEPGLIIYSDLRGIFNLVYNTLLPLGQIAELFIRRQGVPFENAVLPRSEAISQHLTPSITGISTLPEGVIVSSYSTTGITTIGFTAAAIAGVGATLFLSRGGKSRAGGSMAMSNETMAMATLKSIHKAQLQFRAGSNVDQDKNGEGEYGFFKELAGAAPVRGTGNICKPPFLGKEFGFADPKGRVYRNGYYFKIYLPGQTQALGETLSVPEADPKAASRQEKAFCVYAWPASAGATGNRTFFINQTGQIFFTHASLNGYSGDKEPRPEAALHRKGIAPKNLDAVAADGTADLPSSDGEFWMPAD